MFIILKMFYGLFEFLQFTVKWVWKSLVILCIAHTVVCVLLAYDVDVFVKKHFEKERDELWIKEGILKPIQFQKYLN